MWALSICHDSWRWEISKAKYECLINWYDQSDTIVLQESYYTRENSLIDQNAYRYTKLHNSIKWHCRFKVGCQSVKPASVTKDTCKNFNHMTHVVVFSPNRDIVLYCIVLYCIVLYCIVLYCINVLYLLAITAPIHALSICHEAEQYLRPHMSA
jgi:hypothetical protein